MYLNVLTIIFKENSLFFKYIFTCYMGIFIYTFIFYIEKLDYFFFFPFRLEMLKALTDNGKNISYFEEEIGMNIFFSLPSSV